MVTQFNAIYQVIRFIWKRSDGAKFETKLINGMLVICQPSKVKIDGSSVQCSMCKRLNDALLLPEHDPRQLPLPLRTYVEEGKWSTQRCQCNRPARSIGSKNCLVCDLPINA